MKKDRNLNVRVPNKLRKRVKSIVEKGGYMNESDFVRDAIREKLTKMGFNQVKGATPR